jgi:hypothetical protein
MASKRGTEWLSIERPDGHRHLYQISKIEKFDLTDDSVPNCPECGKAVRPEFDVIQFGFWDSRFTTLFTCEPCGKAYRIEYSIASTPIDGVTDKRSL